MFSLLICLRKATCLILFLVPVSVYKNACAVAKEALSLSQKKMKNCFDKRAVVRNFTAGEKVLVLLPAPGSALAA